MTTMKKLIFTILTVLFLFGCRTGPKKVIKYFSNGTKEREETYYKNGNLKTRILYRPFKDSKSVGPQCYKEDRTEETCTLAKHGCTASSNTCLR